MGYVVSAKSDGTALQSQMEFVRNLRVFASCGGLLYFYAKRQGRPESVTNEAFVASLRPPLPSETPPIY